MPSCPVGVPGAIAVAGEERKEARGYGWPSPTSQLAQKPKKQPPPNRSSHHHPKPPKLTCIDVDGQLTMVSDSTSEGTPGSQEMVKGCRTTTESPALGRENVKGTTAAARGRQAASANSRPHARHRPVTSDKGRRGMGMIL